MKYILKHILFLLMIFIISGCKEVRISDYKNGDLLGVWKGEQYNDLLIYTPQYLLSIQKMNNSSFVYTKWKYEISKDKERVLIKSSGTLVLKKDSSGLYLESSSKWLGFIPVDDTAIFRKISEKEAVDIIKSFNITKDKVIYLPIRDWYNGRVKIPDNSAPEIFDKL